MRSVLLLCCVLLLMSACSKGPFTCSCAGGNNDVQNYTITREDQYEARKQCDDYEYNLSRGSVTYDCTLR